MKIQLFHLVILRIFIVLLRLLIYHISETVRYDFDLIWMMHDTSVRPGF